MMTYAHNKQQRGVATLFVTIAVLITTTIMAAFTTKVGVFDQRMAANEAHYTEAFSASEAGLELAVQRFNDQYNSSNNLAATIANFGIPNGTGMNGQPKNDGDPSFGVTLAQTGVVVAGGNALEFTSIGLSSDEKGTATTRRQITMRLVMGGSAPPAPVGIAGSMVSGGDFNIVANPNGGGKGVPLSIWTGDPDRDATNNNTAGSPNGNVTAKGSSATCQRQFWSGNNPQCDNTSGELITDGNGSTLTSYDPGFPDVLPNDPNFPQDLFRFIFGVARADWASVKAMADSYGQVATSCNDLDEHSGERFRLWWITGSCDLGAGDTVGSIDDPVILVIDDQTLTVTSNGVRINGLVFLFENPDNVNHPIAEFKGSSEIHGALISDIDKDGLNGSYSIVYEQQVFDNLLDGNDSANVSLSYVPGSWRDY